MIRTGQPDSLPPLPGITNASGISFSTSKNNVLEDNLNSQQAINNLPPSATFSRNYSTGPPTEHLSPKLPSGGKESQLSTSQNLIDDDFESMVLPEHKSQALIAIFEDALDQLSVLCDISPESIKPQNSKTVGIEISRILRDQKSLENQYQKLVFEQETLKGLPNKTKFKESQWAMLDISNQIQQGKQVLARNLKSHPSVAQNLLKIQNERSSLQALMSKTARELKECQFNSLLNTVEEEYRKKNTLKNTIDRENEASDLLKSLKSSLTNEKRQMEEDIANRTQVIQQLKDTIQEINALTTSEQKYIKKEIKAHESSLRQQCHQRELTTMEQNNLILKQIEQERKVHDKVSDFLKSQREGLEQKIQDWMTKYEEDTEAKSGQLEALKQQRTQDLDKFEELVGKYEELERHVEEYRVAKQKEAEEKRIRAEQHRAAVRLQRWWRRILVKRNFEQQEKKVQKKKKGGKKGAGKGKKGAKTKK